MSSPTRSRATGRRSSAVSPPPSKGPEVGGIWQQGVAGWKATQHLILVDIEPDAEEATISVDAQATHYLPDDLGGSH